VFYTEKRYNCVDTDNGGDALKDETDDIVEIDEEDNFCKPEGVVRFAIDNINKLSSSILSNATYIRGLPWYVSVLCHPRVDNICLRLVTINILVDYRLLKKCQLIFNCTSSLKIW